jgi:hypothetical protein
MNVVLIAHCATVKYEDPRYDPYDRFQPKIPNRISALMQEWCDFVGFASLKISVKTTEAKGFDDKRTRGITSGQRIIHCSDNPAYLAKSRYECPETIDLDFTAFKQCIPVKE